MEKLSLFLASLLLFLLVVDASVFRTTITTTEMDDDDDAAAAATNPRRSQDCREQVRGQQMLNHCQRFLTQICESGGCSRSLNRGEEHYRECCRQLREMDSGCRCDGLEMMISQRMQEEMQGREMDQIMKMAEFLPAMCRLPPMQCSFSGSSYRF